MRIAARICFMIFCAVLCGCSKENVPSNMLTVNATPVSTPVDEPYKPRIIAFGDSLTAGFGLADPKKSYPSLLQDTLAREGFDYYVVNLGLGGDTSAGGIKRLWFALKYTNVKVFILELGANDIVKKVPAAEIKPNLVEIINQVNASGAKVVLCGYAAPSEFGDEYGAEIREMYAELAKEYGLPFIPDFMRDVQGNSERMQADGIHPNENGVEIIEQNVRSVVKTLLTENESSKKK